jgi:hypothetical protein
VIVLAFLLGVAFGLYFGMRVADSMLASLGANLQMHQHQAAELRVSDPLTRSEEFQP